MTMDQAISSSSTPVVYRSLQSYWRRRSRRYQRIDEKNSTDHNRRRTVRLGCDGSESGKGSWKLRLSVLKKVFVRVKVKVPAPKRLLLKLRDSYIGAMHSWAGTVPATEKRKKKKKIAGGTTKAARARRIHSQKEGEMSEFDKKMILHIYNTVMANPNPKELMRT